MYKERKIVKYPNHHEKNYYKIGIVKVKKTQNNNVYEKSIEALVKYMKSHAINPSEKRWNQYAIENQYLSSKAIGYLSGTGFNTLCRKKRKEINKEKKQKEG